MNRIDQLFKRKKEPICSIFFTAGYPRLDDTARLVLALEKGGADIIEIGIPFSDPVADGPVIQKSSRQALENGMNPDVLFNQLTEIRKLSSIPKLLMGYYNVIYQYRIEQFIQKCIACHVDGVIIPDLPPEIYERKYRRLFESADLHFVCLIAPETPPERKKYLTSLTKGFSYLLSSSSTTGQNGMSHSMNGRIHGFSHTLMGFGIHDAESFHIACQQADGAIIGSEFIRKINQNDHLKKLMNPDERLKYFEEITSNFIHKIVRPSKT